MRFQSECLFSNWKKKNNSGMNAGEKDSCTLSRTYDSTATAGIGIEALQKIQTQLSFNAAIYSLMSTQNS